MCPPLQIGDVVQAADKLARRSRPAQAVGQLLGRGADLMTAQRVVEALSALRDAHVTDSDLATWLLAQEIGPEADPSGLSAAAERVCQKLGRRLSNLISPAGSQAILSRSLYLARAEFPFLDGVRARTPPDFGFEGLSRRVHAVGPDQMSQGLRAVLGIVFDLLVGFIGEDVTMGVVAEVWPDVGTRTSPQVDTLGDQAEATS